MSDRTPAEALARARWDRELDPDHPWYVAWDDVSPRLRQEQVEFAEADIELLAAAGFRVVPIPDDNTRALAARARSLLDAATPRPWEPRRSPGSLLWSIHGDPRGDLTRLVADMIHHQRDAELIAAAPTLIAELLAALLDGQPEDRPATCPTCGSDDPAVQRVRGPGQRHCPDPWHVGGSGDTR